MKLDDREKKVLKTRNSDDDDDGCHHLKDRGKRNLVAT